MVMSLFAYREFGQTAHIFEAVSVHELLLSWKKLLLSEFQVCLEITKISDSFQT